MPWLQIDNLVGLQLTFEQPIWVNFQTNQNDLFSEQNLKKSVDLIRLF